MSNEVWVALARGYWPGVPAGHRLGKGGDLAKGPDALPGDIATALAAAAYRLKNGQSAAIAVPPMGPDGLPGILNYLHSCRTESMAGYIRAPWMQPQNMSASPDLLLWTRHTKQKKRLEAHPYIHPHFVGKSKDPKAIQKALSGDEALCRTIVCQQDSATRPMCEELQRQAHPFLVVIDATPWGCRDNLRLLIDMMGSNFPGTPVLVLMATGDLETQREIARSKIGFRVWKAGKDDPVACGVKGSGKWSGKVAVLPDKRLNDRLSSIYRHLMVMDEQITSADNKQTRAELLRVWKSIIAMPVPYSFYEMTANLERRGGPFSFRPMNEVITVAAREKMNSGVAQEALDAVCGEFVDLFAYLEEGKTGKQQAVERWIHETLSANKKGTIIMASGREAKMLRRWMTGKYAAQVERRDLQVINAKGLNELYNLKADIDRVMVIGNLWFSDFWVPGLAEEFTWAIYPIQTKFTEKWSKVMRQIKRSGENQKKEAWWTFEEEEPVTDGLPLEMEEWRDCSGQYVETKEFVFEPPARDDWADGFLDGFEWKDEPEEAPFVKPTDRHVSIYTGEQTYFFHETDRLDVLVDGEDEVQRRLVVDIAPGDTIVFQSALEEDASLLDTVMEIRYGATPELEFTRNMAAQWHNLIGSAYERHGKDIKALHKKLEKQKVTLVTLRHWVTGRHVISERKDQIIPEIARLSGENLPEQTVAMIRKCMGTLQGMRANAGKTLHAAKIAIANDHSEVKVGTVSLPIDTLREALHFEEVVSIRKPDPLVDEEGEASWKSVIFDLIDAKNSGLTITSRGRKSLEGCQFKDGPKIVRCFELIHDTLAPVYTQKTPMAAAVETLKRAGIDFKAGMSQVTQGKNKQDYQRVWKDKKVDIGRHLGIGNGYSKEICFRLHYSIDEGDGLLVIHHAGSHLKTGKA
jgi:hypothetical protein